MKNRFLDPIQIGNYEDILDVIINKGANPEVLAIEELGDIIYMLNKNDKQRDLTDPELKAAVFTIIKGLMKSNKVRLRFDLSWVMDVQSTPPEEEDAIFNYLDYYWDKTDGIGLNRDYLLWFEKINN